MATLLRGLGVHISWREIFSLVETSKSSTPARPVRAGGSATLRSQALSEGGKPDRLQPAVPKVPRVP
jgi:hypothetical protein